MHTTTIANRSKGTTHPRPAFISNQIESGEYYYLNLQPENQTYLTIACGGVEQCAHDYRIERNEFEYFGIEYIVTGKCKLTLAGKESILRAGSFFGYSSNSSHTIENIGNSPLVKYFIDFSGSEAKELFMDSPLAKNRSYNQPQNEWIKNTFQNLQECGLAGGTAAQTICGNLLRYFFARLDEKELPNEETVTPSLTSFETCRSYVEHFYFKINGAHEIADACHISHPHLCRLFKRFSDETPSQMLLRLKLNHSVGLLEQGHLLVKEIAERVGFDDQYYFSRRFKEYFGVSPKNYVQKRNWNSDREKVAS